MRVRLENCGRVDRHVDRCKLVSMTIKFLATGGKTFRVPGVRDNASRAERCRALEQYLASKVGPDKVAQVSDAFRAALALQEQFADAYDDFEHIVAEASAKLKVRFLFSLWLVHGALIWATAVSRHQGHDGRPRGDRFDPPACRGARHSRRCELRIRLSYRRLCTLFQTLPQHIRAAQTDNAQRGKTAKQTTHQDTQNANEQSRPGISTHLLTHTQQQQQQQQQQHHHHHHQTRAPSSG
jgi:hypothetical protein